MRVASENSGGFKPQGPKTLAQASRERRDLVTGEVMAEDRLIRFVAGPGGVVTPDLARKLPGRGLWVAANRSSVETAAKKGLFSRAAKTKLVTGPDLADQVDTLLARRVLEGLGLAKRAGDLISGFEKVAAALEAGRAAWLVEASDGAPDGRRKVLNIVRRSAKAPQLMGVYTAQELGLALGRENVIHTAFLAGRGADRWTFDVLRLSGFRPLLPTSWREES